MAKALLKFMLFVVGAIALISGIIMFVLGPDYVDVFLQRVLQYTLGDHVYIVDISRSDVENELRFYSVFWAAYGAIVIQTARQMNRYWSRVPLLLGLLFAGGIGRLLSYMTNSFGPPHELFVILMFVELIVPLVLLGFWEYARPSNRVAGHKS